MRVRAASLFLLVGLGAALSGCSVEPAPDANGASEQCEPIGGGEAAESVSVEGELGAEPEIEFEAPLSVAETQRTVLIDGDGKLVERGDTVDINFTILNGETGEQVSTTGHTEGTAVPIQIDEEVFLAGLVDTIACSPEGSRIVGVIPPSALWGEAGADSLGVTGEQSLVFVADIGSLAAPPLERAEGEPQDVPEGMPGVELADDGTPTVSIPDADPPAELQISVLQKADGAVVEEGDTVTVHYHGISWTTGEVFDDSWSRGAPAQFPTNGVIPGFSAALVGQNVGSQVMAVIPPEQGYGTDPEAHDLGGQTLVFVVDILATS